MPPGGSLRLAPTGTDVIAALESHDDEFGGGCYVTHRLVNAEVHFQGPLFFVDLFVPLALVVG